jgi:dienelactone hydrolase
MLRRLLTLVCCIALLPPPLRAQDAVDPVPADDARYAEFAKQYDYDAQQPLNAKVVSTSMQGTTTVEDIAFDSINGERVPGILIRPASTKPLPVLLGLHGLGGSKNDIANIAPMLSMFGVQVAVLALDAQYHGARKVEGHELLSRDLEGSKKAFIQSVVDYRRALDYLDTRPEFDPDRVGLVGMSMGGMMGTILTALEPRIKTAVLAVPAADWVTLAKESASPVALQLRDDNPNFDFEQFRRTLDPVDPLHFAPRLAGKPILLLHANSDEIIPRHCAELLDKYAQGEPVEVQWYESGHLLPPQEAGLKILTWVQARL